MVFCTEKANGENAQISFDKECECWIIGTKNKTLLLEGYKDLKYIKNKHEHLLTCSIAEQWFGLINSIPNLEELKEELSKYTLIGEHCNSVKNGHIIDYGEDTKLLFYALV